MIVKAKNALKYIISLALAALLLWASFREVEWNDFRSELRNCRWEFILLSMSAGAFAFWLRALRWRRLLLPIDDSITRITTFNGISIGNISNFVFPRIGEFVRCGVITRHSAFIESESDQEALDAASAGYNSSADDSCTLQRKATYDKVLGTVVLERSWELLVMLLLLAVVVIGGFDRFGSFFVEQILTPISSRFDFSLWWIISVLAAVACLSVYSLWHFRDTNAFCSKVVSIIRGILQGFASCWKMDKKWLFFAYTVLIWMTYWFMAASTMWAAPFLEDLDIIDALFLSLVGGLGFAIPVPGGIGAFHFIIGLALSVIYGLPMELGIIYATLSHTSQAITQIIFGLGSYAYEAIRK